MSDPLVCYIAGNNVISSTNQYFPCGTSDISGASAQACCNAEDYCMEDSICHYTRGGVTNGTGYYMGGCTDPTWQDPACPMQCTSEFRPDIIYDRGNSEWRCCESTEDSLNCQSPSEFVVEAPDPGELSTIIQLTTAGPSSTLMTGTTTLTPSASSAASTTAKASATSTSTSPAIPTSSNLPTSDLSAGAKAGIAIAIIAGIAVVIGGFFYYKIRGVKPSNISTKKHKSEESRNIAMPENPYRPSGAFTKISSQPNSALPSPAIGSGPNSAFPSPAIGSPGFQHDTARESGFSVGLQRDVRRESEFPISLHEQDVGAKRKSRFSYEYDTGPYEMETPTVHHRVPYERPLSAQELEGTRVIVQELDAMPRDKET